MRQIILQITSIWIYYKLINSWVWIFEEQQTVPQYPWYQKKQKQVSDKNLFRSDSFLFKLSSLFIYFLDNQILVLQPLWQSKQYHKAILKVFINIAEIAEAATHRCWVAILKIFAKFTEKHLCQTPFQMKLQSFSLQVYQKVTPRRSFFEKFVQIAWTAVFQISPHGSMGYSLRIKDTIY